MPAPPDVASWLEIDRDALRHNVRTIRELVGGAGLGVVVKSDAYGHGLHPVLEALHDLTDVLYVVTAPEALAVRGWEASQRRPARDVLVIGPISGREGIALACAGVDVVAGDAGFAAVAREVARADAPPLRVHVHVDTGLSREGFAPEALGEGLAWLDEVGGAVEVAGVLTHFADTEDVTEQTWARHQLRRFDEGLAALEARLVASGRPTALARHAAASAAAMVLPESRLDTVRVGLSAYGLWPSRETRLSARLVFGRLPELRPALAWRSPSQLVKTVPEGSFVGYGCTHRCAEATRIAVLPVGYHDGYPRLLSNRAHVLVRGRRCAVLGRVMMNHVVVDVSRVPGLSDGDAVVATLIGRDGAEEVTVDDVAGWAQTIGYEIVARLGSHLRRERIGVADAEAPT